MEVSKILPPSQQRMTDLANEHGILQAKAMVVKTTFSVPSPTTRF
jgi:hypothetical protein